MSSRQPRQVSCEAATREARVSPEEKGNQNQEKPPGMSLSSNLKHTRSYFCLYKRQFCSVFAVTKKLLIFQPMYQCKFTAALPGIVTIGVPAQSTSMPVVCPLQRGVSRQTSANCPLLTCSSLGATGEKMIRFWARPKFCAYCWILGSPTAGKRSSHSTLLGTLFRICNKNKKIQEVQRGTFTSLNSNWHILKWSRRYWVLWGTEQKLNRSSLWMRSLGLHFWSHWDSNFVQQFTEQFLKRVSELYDLVYLEY